MRVATNAELVQDSREGEPPKEKKDNADGDVDNCQRQHGPTSEKREQRLRYLIETRSPTAWGQAKTALQKAGEQVARHRSASNQGPDFPFQADSWRKR